MPKCDFNKISLKLLLRLRGGGGGEIRFFLRGKVSNVAHISLENQTVISEVF